LSVANCVTYFLEDFILEGGKVGYGGAYLTGQRIVGRAVLIQIPGYLVEVVNKTDTNIFIQTTDTAIGKDELSLFVNAAPNATTKGFAFFDPGVKMDPSATVRGTILALYGSDYSMDSFNVMF